MSVQEIIQKHEPSRSSLIPILQDVQNQMGYLPPEAIMQISRYLKMSEAEIYGVATFYAQFRFKPIGKHVFTVCRGTACHVRGSAQILEELERELGIKAGDTTDDLQFSIETVACVGSCALAPLTVVDGKVYGRTTKSKIRNLIKELRSGEEGKKIATPKEESEDKKEEKTAPKKAMKRGTKPRQGRKK